MASLFTRFWRWLPLGMSDGIALDLADAATRRIAEPKDPIALGAVFTPEQEARIGEIVREEAYAAILRFDQAVGDAVAGVRTRSPGVRLGTAGSDSLEGTA